MSYSRSYSVGTNYNNYQPSYYRSPSYHRRGDYQSNVENQILNSNNPIHLNEHEEINVNGHHGLFANKCEVRNWRGRQPIENYPINHDPCPIVIKKRASSARVTQEIGVKYLKPRIQQPGPIIIRQAPNRNMTPAPPVIIRQKPAPPKCPTTQVYREAPPNLPPAPGTKCIVVPGKFNPPPARKVIIEKLPRVNQPDNMYVERWVDAAPVKRWVKFEPAPDTSCLVEKPKNIVVEWEANTCVRQVPKNLGVCDADTNDYRQRNCNLLNACQLPDAVKRIQPPCGLKLSSCKPNKCQKDVYELAGDLHALALVDLEKEGLGEYREVLQRLGINQCCAPCGIRPGSCQGACPCGPSPCPQGGQTPCPCGPNTPCPCGPNTPCPCGPSPYPRYQTPCPCGPSPCRCGPTPCFSCR